MTLPGPLFLSVRQWKTMNDWNRNANLCEQFAGESHWHVTRVFEECASGVEPVDDRPALCWMIHDAEANIFDKLIVLCAEHLSRDGDSFVAITNRLRRAGVEIVFLE